MLNIVRLQSLCHDKNIAITKHANNRLIERGIDIDDIKCVILSGEIIQQYEDDKPFPSCLVLGKALNCEYIHVVVSIEAETLYIITAYHPNKTKWEHDLKTRKEH